MGDFIYCSTMLKQNLELAIDKTTKIFNKCDLNLPFDSAKKLLFFTTSPKELFEYAKNSYPISDYSFINNDSRSEWGLEIEGISKQFMRRDYLDVTKFPYCPMILGRYDFVQADNFSDLRIVCFSEDFKLPGISYSIKDYYLSPSLIKINFVLGVKNLKFDEYKNKTLIFEDLTDYYLN